MHKPFKGFFSFFRPEIGILDNGGVRIKTNSFHLVSLNSPPPPEVAVLVFVTDD